MKADGVMGSPRFQHGHGRTAGGKEILGVDFQKGQRGLAIQQFSVMRVPPSYAHRACVGTQAFVRWVEHGGPR